MFRTSFLLGLIFGATFSLCSTSFAQTGSISGRVTDVDHNPIENALVDAIADPEGWIWGSTYSDSNGSYKITDLPTGDYRVRASAKGYAREYYDNTTFSNEATIVHVTTLFETFGIDFGLTIGGAISGHVYQSDGVSPISGAQVTVKPSSTEWEDDGFHDTTASDGSFQVEGLALGEYHVYANAENWVPEWHDNAFDLWYATDVKVVPPETTSEINITLSRGGAISGFVYDSTGVNPIQGAWLEAGGMSPYCGGNGVVSLENGSYTITDLPTCDYRVAAEKHGFAPIYYNSVNNGEDADTVIVTEGDTTFGIDFTLEVGGAVTGHVYVYEGDTTKPISGIVVKAALPTGEPLYEFGNVTDLDGSYTIWLATGSYFIRTDAHAYGQKYIDKWYNDKDIMENADTVRVIAPDTTSDIDFYLVRTGGAIAGHICNASTGDSLANANIYAFPVEDWLTGGGANSDSIGYYQIWGLAWGNYIVKVTRSGCATADTQITVAPDETTYVDFELECVLGIAEQTPFTVPSVFSLYQNHPNPFVLTTTIKFALPKESQVSLKIYDMSGRLVRTLIDREIDAGYHEVIWGSRDDNGKLLPKGVYFCRFVVKSAGEIREFRATKKLISFR